MQESDLTLDDVDFAATTGYNLKLAGIAEALCNEELNFPTGPLVTPLPTKFSESTLFMNFILSGSDPEKIPTIRNEFVRKPLEAFPLELRKRWFDESQEVLSWIG